MQEVHVLPGGGCRVAYALGEESRSIEADHVWSTIPVTLLARNLRPAAPAEVLEATQRIRFRGMILIYLVLGQKRFTEFDAHYFPETEVPITRMSEPRNYSTVESPDDRTVPCSAGDAHWNMTDEALGRDVQEAHANLGLPVRSAVRQVVTRRLPQAYPIYERGYEVHFERIDRWLEGVPNVLTLGRQGLFAHDNTHHTLAMAYAAADCIDAGGRFDRERWAAHRKVFESHVVED